MVCVPKELKDFAVEHLPFLMCVILLKAPDKAGLQESADTHQTVNNDEMSKN